MAQKSLRWQRPLTMLSHALLIVLVIAALYFLKGVLIPLALGLYFSFLLYPFFKWLYQRGLPRQVAVGVVVLGTLILLGSMCWIISWQLSNLAAELPDYTRNITKKLESLQEMTSGSGRWNYLTTEITRVISGKSDSSAPESEAGLATSEPPKKQEQPATVVVKEENPRWVAWVMGIAGVALGFVGELALAMVLVIFILLKREDLLNRVLRLAGPRRVSTTSKAVSETGKRISRFLLVQFIVNSMFGILLSVGLLILGVNYALLWGFLTTILRYLPYIGPWISAIFPLAMSLAQFDGWMQPVSILVIYLTLEIVISNLVEPYLYGHSIGVSEVALLVAAAFWGWMWGIVGLVLSAPLTVVMVVLGKYVSELNYLTILFSDEPALSRDMSLYQRLLAGDVDEAERLMKSRVGESEPEQVYDEMLIPALYHMKLDVQRRMIDREDSQEVLRTMSELLEEYPSKTVVSEERSAVPMLAQVPLLVYAVRDEADHLAMKMLAQRLDETKWNCEVTPVSTLSSEVIAKLKEENHRALCLGTLQPGGSLHLRHLCKKIRLEHPEVKILVVMLGPDEIHPEKVKLLENSGADWVGNTLEGVAQTLDVWYPVWSEKHNKQVA